MIILDTLVIGGIKFVLRRIAEAVDAEMNDVDVLREELLAAQMRLELGELSAEEFVEGRARPARPLARAPGRGGRGGRRTPAHLRHRRQRCRRRRRRFARRITGPVSGRPAPTPGLHVFGGKGGVGKTTCAAATAVAAAERGRRVGLVSTDPAHSLGDAVGRRLGAGARRLPVRRGTLEAVELDADRALARWLARRRSTLRTIAERGTYLDDEDLERLLRLSFPGVDELMALVEVARLAARRRWELVVVDTAPTGHTLRMLDTPRVLQRHGRRAGRHARQAPVSRPTASAAVIGPARPTDSSASSTPTAASWRPACATPPGAASPGCCSPSASRWKRRATAWPRWPPPASRSASWSSTAARRRRRPARSVTGAAPRRRACWPSARRAFPTRRLRALPALDPEPRGLAALRRDRPPAGGAHRCPRCLRARGRAARAPVRPHVAAPSGSGAAWLDRLARSGLRLIVFAGKGGVGKSTCAAATALALARRRPDAPVLLLSADPAHSLGDVLETALNDDERPVPGAPAGLRARELDADGALARMRARYRDAVEETFDALLRGSRFDVAYDRQALHGLMDLAPPGLDELFAVLAVVEALLERRPPYAVVVLDAAPTGHALAAARDARDRAGLGPRAAGHLAEVPRGGRPGRGRRRAGRHRAPPARAARAARRPRPRRASSPSPAPPSCRSARPTGCWLGCGGSGSRCRP